MTVWTFLDPWLPYVHVWWLEPQLKSQEPAAEYIAAIVGDLRIQPDPARAAAAAEAIALAETARIDGLERKLDGHRATFVALSTFAVALLGWAINQRSLPAIIPGVVAAAYLAAGWLTAMRGGSATRRFILSAGALRALLSEPDAVLRAAATRLAYAKSNEMYGVRLANSVSTAQRSAFIAALALGIDATIYISRVQT